MTVLGILGIIVFCALVVGLASAVTWLVVRFLPAKSKKPKTAADA